MQVVMRALRAGKHVISEKPIAPTIEEARENIEAYRALNNGAVWNIAENFRYEDVFEAQADLVAKIGNVVKMDLLADMPMSEGNKCASNGSVAYALSSAKALWQQANTEGEINVWPLSAADFPFFWSGSTV